MSFPTAHCSYLFLLWVEGGHDILLVSNSMDALSLSSCELSSLILTKPDAHEKIKCNLNLSCELYPSYLQILSIHSNRSTSKSKAFVLAGCDVNECIKWLPHDFDHCRINAVRNLRIVWLIIHKVQ